MKKLYVGNLSYNTTEESLRAMFEQHGEVNSAKVIMDRDTGRSRGFGFVEMDDSGANARVTVRLAPRDVVRFRRRLDRGATPE